MWHHGNTLNDDTSSSTRREWVTAVGLEPSTHAYETGTLKSYRGGSETPATVGSRAPRTLSTADSSVLWLRREELATECEGSEVAREMKEGGNERNGRKPWEERPTKEEI